MSDLKTNKYPVTKETLHAYAASIFTPIQKKESVTTVWPPMAGRRMWNKFIIENAELFEEELPNIDKYVLVYIEPLDLTEESLSGYLRLIGMSLVQVFESKGIDLETDYEEKFSNDEVTYSRLLHELRKMIHTVINKGYEIVLFFGEFDELHFANTIFYHNLKSLWNNLYPGLHYVFLMRERVTREENVEQWGELNEVILQNTIHIPLLGSKDIDYLFDRFSKEYSLTLRPDHKTLLTSLCGGHPYLLKVCFRVLSKSNQSDVGIEELKKIITDYYEIKSVARGILSVRSEKEKKLLKEIAIKGSISDTGQENAVRFLERIGMIMKDNDTYKPFGDLFAQAILGSSEPKENDIESSNAGLKVDSGSGAILFNGNTVEEKFTHQEYVVLSSFLEKYGKLITRDDIGEVLWGKESYEKYSDWAIDQLMSKLRKKLKDLGVKEKIVTIRGKGYKITV